MREPQPPQGPSKKIDAVQLTPVQIEELKKRLDTFVGEILNKLKYWNTNIKNTAPKMHLIPPQEVDYENLYLNSMDYTDSVDSIPPPSLLKACEYTINPETIGIDWDKLSPEKVKILQFPGFFREAEDSSDLDAKGKHKLVEYIMNAYPDRDKYYFPGFEYEVYLIEHPDKIPESIRALVGNFHFYIGSLLQDGQDDVRIPHATGYGGKISHGVAPFFVDCDPRVYVVAIEK